jgi:hypothetical protein
MQDGLRGVRATTVEERVNEVFGQLVMLLGFSCEPWGIILELVGRYRWVVMPRESFYSCGAEDMTERKDGTAVD